MGAQAKVVDGSGNPIAGAVVIFTAPSSGARATFGGSATACDASISTNVRSRTRSSISFFASSFSAARRCSGVGSAAAGVAVAETSVERPLFAYIGTFSSPLKDVLPTQVDLPPGNGRGIHIFRVDRRTGGLTAAGTYDLGTSPSCLAVNAAADRLYSANETDRVGETKEGTVSAFSIDAKTGALTLLNTVRSGGAGPTYVALHPSGRYLLTADRKSVV